MQRGTSQLSRHVFPSNLAFYFSSLVVVRSAIFFLFINTLGRILTMDTKYKYILRRHRIFIFVYRARNNFISNVAIFIFAKYGFQLESRNFLFPFIIKLVTVSPYNGTLHNIVDSNCKKVHAERDKCPERAAAAGNLPLMYQNAPTHMCNALRAKPHAHLLPENSEFSTAPQSSLSLLSLSS